VSFPLFPLSLLRICSQRGITATSEVVVVVAAVVAAAAVVRPQMMPLLLDISPDSS
jgi:hypothetical protein